MSTSPPAGGRRMAAQGQGANPYRVRAYHRAATTATLPAQSGDGDAAARKRGRSPEVAGARRKPDAEMIHDLCAPAGSLGLDGCRDGWPVLRFRVTSRGSAPCWRSNLHCDSRDCHARELKARSTTAAWPRSPDWGEEVGGVHQTPSPPARAWSAVPVRLRDATVCC